MNQQKLEKINKREKINRKREFRKEKGEGKVRGQGFQNRVEEYYDAYRKGVIDVNCVCFMLRPRDSVIIYHTRRINHTD